MSVMVTCVLLKVARMLAMPADDILRVLGLDDLLGIGDPRPAVRRRWARRRSGDVFRGLRRGFGGGFRSFRQRLFQPALRFGRGFLQPRASGFAFFFRSGFLF